MQGPLAPTSRRITKRILVRTDSRSRRPFKARPLHPHKCLWAGQRRVWHALITPHVMHQLLVATAWLLASAALGLAKHQQPWQLPPEVVRSNSKARVWSLSTPETHHQRSLRGRAATPRPSTMTPATLCRAGVHKQRPATCAGRSPTPTAPSASMPCYRRSCIWTCSARASSWILPSDSTRATSAGSPMSPRGHTRLIWPPSSTRSARRTSPPSTSTGSTLTVSTPSPMCCWAESAFCIRANQHIWHAVRIPSHLLQQPCARHTNLTLVFHNTNTYAAEQARRFDPGYPTRSRAPGARERPTMPIRTASLCASSSPTLAGTGVPPWCLPARTSRHTRAAWRCILR